MFKNVSSIVCAPASHFNVAFERFRYSSNFLNDEVSIISQLVITLYFYLHVEYNQWYVFPPCNGNYG